MRTNFLEVPPPRLKRLAANMINPEPGEYLWSNIRSILRKLFKLIHYMGYKLHDPLHRAGHADSYGEINASWRPAVVYIRTRNIYGVLRLSMKKRNHSPHAAFACQIGNGCFTLSSSVLQTHICTPTPHPPHYFSKDKVLIKWPSKIGHKNRRETKD